jgi:hypothetical protein
VPVYRRERFYDRSDPISSRSIRDADVFGKKPELAFTVSRTDPPQETQEGIIPRSITVTIGIESILFFSFSL